MLILQQKPGFEDVKLRVAGYLGKAHQHWFAALEAKIRRSPLGKNYTYFGEVDRAGKLGLMDSVDVFAVPTAYAEPKGLYVLEALARGAPVVLPHHGSFPELVRETGGGITTPPGDRQALVEMLAEMLNDPPRRAEMGRRGHAAVRERFLDTHMAEKMLDVYRAAMGQGVRV
jgi:glycosyltransferase involved in cell wall biosynthesis